MTVCFSESLLRAMPLDLGNDSNCIIAVNEVVDQWIPEQMMGIK